MAITRAQQAKELQEGFERRIRSWCEETHERMGKDLQNGKV